MDGLWVGVYLAAVAAAGYVAASGLSPRRKLGAADALGLVLLLGPAALALALFALSVGGLAAGRREVLAVTAAALGGAGWLARSRRGITVDLGRLGARLAASSWLERALLAAMALPLAWLFVHHALLPAHDWDSWAIWAFKGRVLAAEPVVASPLFREPGLAFSHPDYPLLVPLNIAAQVGLAGGGTPPFSTWVVPLLLTGAAAVLYAALRRRLPHPLALAIPALWLWTPALLEWGTTADADLPLAAYLAGAVAALLAWADGGSGRLRRFAAFTAALVWTKNEGLPLALLLLAGLALLLLRRRADWRRAVAAAGLAAALALPWLLLQRTLPASHEDYAGRLTWAALAAGAERLPAVLAALGSELASPGRWGALWWLPLLAVASALRHRPPGYATLWLLLAGQLSLYAAIYLVTPWELGQLLPISLTRLLLQASPLAVLLTGWGLARRPEL